MFRGAALVLVAAVITGVLLVLLRLVLPPSAARSWVADRGSWLVWPVVALELVVLGTWWLGAGALVAGAIGYWLDSNGRLRLNP